MTALWNWLRGERQADYNGASGDSGASLRQHDPASLGAIYSKAAAVAGARRRPTVFIPGIMGSRLTVTGSSDAVWGEFGNAVARKNADDTRQLIALPLAQGRPLHSLKSLSAADGTVRRARLWGLPISVGIYDGILDTVGASLGTGRGVRLSQPASSFFTSFEFEYDWRRSLDETAAQLHEFLQLAASIVQASRENSAPVQFDVVAHSMGGLILRYYLQYGAQLLPSNGQLPQLTWAGCNLVAKAILVATPNAGAAISIRTLIEGLPGRPLVHPGYDQAITGTMPSLYQLMPRTRHNAIVDQATHETLDPFDENLWHRFGWGLAGPDIDDTLKVQMQGSGTPSSRRDAAGDHLGKCLRNARNFHAAMDLQTVPPEGTELHLVAGDGRPTVRRLGVAASSGSLAILAREAGDGTVIRGSALLDERMGLDDTDASWFGEPRSPIPWKSVIFLNAEHMAMINDRVAVDNLLFRLFEAPN